MVTTVHSISIVVIDIIMIITIIIYYYYYYYYYYYFEYVQLSNLQSTGQKLSNDPANDCALHRWTI